MINEAKLLLLLLSLGGQGQVAHEQVLKKLDHLVATEVSQSAYKKVANHCQIEAAVFDYMITSEDKIVVDYDAVVTGEDKDCQVSQTSKEQVCRAIFTKNEQLERVNCR